MRYLDFKGGAAVRGVVEAFLSGAPPHATLFFGPVGVGKKTLANRLAQSLFCTGMEKPCGVCPGCVRVQVGSHPDFIRISAQKSIGVDPIRELTVSLRAAAYEGGFKAVVIEEAGAMTVQAQNALLKTLEEPPPATVFLLTATSLAQLLPTIRSRCLPIQIPPMPEADVHAALIENGVDAARAAEIAPLCGGRIGVALSLLSDEGYWALRSRVQDVLALLDARGDVWSAVAALKEEKAEAQRICDLMEELLLSRLKQALSERTAGRDRGLARLTAFVPEMRKMLKSNVPWQAVWERFVLEYAEESKQWQS